MIRATNLHKRFGPEILFNGLSFSVEREELFVILGKSGTGKSTLLKIVAGLIAPDQGDLSVQTKNIGMLFQRNALFDSLTVYENLEFVLKNKGGREHLNDASYFEEEILRHLEWVGLAPFANHLPSGLSGGMQKRLGIARAVIARPDLLLYDEPTAGLDPITSKVIADLILRLTREHKTTVVLVTSDLMRAQQLADRMVFLHRDTNATYLLQPSEPAAKPFFEKATYVDRISQRL